LIRLYRDGMRDAGQQAGRQGDANRYTASQVLR
jgi:hypothetical protein